MPEQNQSPYKVSFMVTVQDILRDSIVCMLAFFADTKTKEQHDAVMDELRQTANALSVTLSMSSPAQYPGILDAVCSSIQEQHHVDCRVVISLGWQAYCYHPDHPLNKEAENNG